MTHRLPIIFFLAALAAPLAHAQTPQPPAAKPSTKPYLTVNGTPIPQHIVDAHIAEQKQRGVDTTTPAFQAALREEMIHRGALLAEAKKQSLDKRPAYKQQLELAAQLLLMREAIAEHLKRNPITEAEMTAAYQAALTQLGDSEYRLRHIQSKTEADAREIIANSTTARNSTNS
jgi:peptidyl-prolyl cis-trans isomerase C